MSSVDSERNQLIQYLTRTRNDLVEVLEGLSETQTVFKPAPERWSIAGVVEHIALVESFAGNKILEEMAATTPVESVPSGEPDEALLKKAMDRSRKFDAPSELRPTGKPLGTSLQQFLSERKKIVDFVLAAPYDLRRLTMQHRVFGRIDGHQRLLALAGHSARHTNQIIEVKAAPDFPVVSQFEC
jgi:hypothetical protein